MKEKLNSSSLPTLKKDSQDNLLLSILSENSDFVSDDEELAKLKADCRILENQLSKLETPKRVTTIKPKVSPSTSVVSTNHTISESGSDVKYDSATLSVKEPDTPRRAPRKVQAPIQQTPQNQASESNLFTTPKPTSSPRSIRNRIKILQTKSENGDANAQYSLGACYMRGEGVPQDVNKAFEYYLMAANQGDKSAQFSVATCYSYGKGTELNKEKALEFYLKSAEQGYDKSQFAVGHFYEYGQGGLDINHDVAIEWYKKAAEQGHRGALKVLAEHTEE